MLLSCWSVEGFNPDLANWSITEIMDSIRFGLFKLVTVVHLDFCFFSTGLIFLQGIIMLEGRGVLKVETKNGSPKNNCPL